MADRILIADGKVVIAFYYNRTSGTITMTYPNWADSRTLRPGEAFEVRAGPQGSRGG